MKHYTSPRKMDEVGEKLADRLRACRHRLGENQAEFAVRLGISRYTYMRWERYGPPNTRAHRGYVRLMLRQIGQGPVKQRVRYEKKRAEKLRLARLALAAD